MTDERFAPRLILLGLLGFLWGEVTAWSWAVAVVLLVLSVISVLMGWRSPHRSLTSVVAILCGALVYIPAGTLIGRDPSAALLGILAGLKALESREASDERTLHLIGLFFVLVLFLFRSDLWSLLAGLGAAAFFLNGLIRHQPAAPSAELSRRWTLRLSLQAAPLALLLFFAFPRLEHAGLWNMAARGLTGFSNDLDPGRVDRIEEDPTPVLRARWSPGPPREPVFWRGAVLERTNGFAWYPAGRAPPEPEEIENAATPRTVEWILEESGRWVFAPEGSLWVRDDENRALSGSAEDGVWRWLAPPGTRVQLRAGVDLNLRRRGLENPRLIEVPAIGATTRAWAERLKSAKTRDDAVNELIGLYRENGFVYTRRPGRMESLENFFERRQGYCEHYASSAALVLRSAGIPARVVVGFLGGEWNPVGGFQLVTRADAHAWTEWLDENGVWRSLDVTASVPPADPLLDQRLRATPVEIGKAPWWDQLRWNVESLNYRFAAFLMGFDLSSQTELWQRLRATGPATAVAALLVLMALAVTFARGRWAFSSSRREAREINAYRKWLARGQRKGWELSPHAGPLENLRRALERAPHEEDRSRRVVESYVKVRFRSAD